MPNGVSLFGALGSRTGRLGPEMPADSVGGQVQFGDAAALFRIDRLRHRKRRSGRRFLSPFARLNDAIVIRRDRVSVKGKRFGGGEAEDDQVVVAEGDGYGRRRVLIV